MKILAKYMGKRVTLHFRLLPQEHSFLESARPAKESHRLPLEEILTRASSKSVLVGLKDFSKVVYRKLESSFLASMTGLVSKKFGKSRSATSLVLETDTDHGSTDKQFEMANAHHPSSSSAY